MSEPASRPAGGAALLINARSRLGHRAEDLVADALKRRGQELTRIVRVRRPSRLTLAVDALLAQGIDRLIVGGGDGTLGTVAPRLARRDVLLGVIPLGTANDFARTLHIPRSLEQAAAIAADDHESAVDLARVNDVYFLNVASVGMSVALTHALSPRLKRWLGPAAYAVAGVGAFVRHAKFRARIESPEIAVSFEGIAHQVVVANGRFYGGGVLADHTSTLEDGSLTIYTLGASGRWELLRTMFLMRLQVRLDRPGDAFRRVTRVRLETWPPRPVNLDGEIRTQTPAEFVVEPGALRVLTPRPNDFVET